jgi:SAM-dependent methyltransferase
LSEKTFLDIGCNIGYFLNQFNKYCEKVIGIDYDSNLKKESDIFYPEIAKNILNVDYTKRLKDFEQFDIVSFMSLFHHIIISEGLESAIKVLKIVDEKTKEIMFFEMAQEHERFYNGKLPGWNIDKIKNFIIDNTSFNRCETLMVDSDSVGKFSDDFGRTLFAFYRDKE